jgi:hypothetical protein
MTYSCLSQYSEQRLLALQDFAVPGGSLVRESRLPVVLGIPILDIDVYHYDRLTVSP